MFALIVHKFIFQMHYTHAVWVIEYSIKCNAHLVLKLDIRHLYKTRRYLLFLVNWFKYIEIIFKAAFDLGMYFPLIVTNEGFEGRSNCILSVKWGRYLKSKVIFRVIVCYSRKVGMLIIILKFVCIVIICR